nr:cytosolic carboxypeptidase 6 [Onthophagus taurus]
MGDFGEDSDESDGEGCLGNVNRVIMRPPGHSGKAKRGHLCFDASFETGNLGRVDLINEHEYDLFIRPDTCNPKLRFWFNFTVDNVKQDQRVIFNITNISKVRNLFNFNLTPLVKSTSRQKWQRIPKKNVFYHRSPFHQNNYVLTFTFAFDKEDEIYQFALSYPYSYSKLQMFLKSLETKGSKYVKRETLGNSIQKRKLDLITISNETSVKSNKVNVKQRIVIIMARLHPGEAASSFVCQGLMEFLISSHPIPTLLREHVTFKIIPMLNPDGVFLGNYRSTVMGFDLNRFWHVSSEWTHPTLKATLDMVVNIENNKDCQLDIVIDIHAHSSLTGCFIYGNSYEDVYRYERHTVFPKILSTLCDDYVKENTMFNSDQHKLGTARRYLCAVLNNNVNCYTFEVSLFGYKLEGSNVIIPYTEENYMRCGRNLIRALLEYYKAIGAIPEQLLSTKKKKYRRRRSRSTLSSRRVSPTRIPASIYYKELNMNYESDFSDDFNSYRHPKIPSKFAEKQEKRIKKVGGGGIISTGITSPKIQYLGTPEPYLSIVDFNMLVDDLDKVSKK